MSPGLTRRTAFPASATTPGAFVTRDEGVLDLVRADGIGDVIMEVAAADADGPAADEDVVVPGDARRRRLADFDRPDPGEERGSHGCPIIRQVGGIRRTSSAAF
ncbi:MAG: hypothetical protein MZV63_41245 [Marinilabiliales bacterium]|nr:hypothetical protein [Marinilabiliales bacterium]